MMITNYIDYIYLIDTRSRFCELGAWAPTETEFGDLVLRRVMSLGSVWDVLADAPDGKFNPLGVPIGVLGSGYKALSSEGFVTGCWWGMTEKRVAAIVDSGGKIKKKGENCYLCNGIIRLPKKQPIKKNKRVTEAAKEVLRDRARGGYFLYLAEGQSNELQYLEFTDFSRCVPVFPPEHKKTLRSLICAPIVQGHGGHGRYWSFREKDIANREDEDLCVLRNGFTVFLPEDFTVPGQKR